MVLGRDAHERLNLFRRSRQHRDLRHEHQILGVIRRERRERLLVGDDGVLSKGSFQLVDDSGG
jgi:hypothetical protein